MATPWSVPRDWDDETCAVLASGPSMSAEVAASVRGKCRVIAVNNQGIPNVVGNEVVPALAPWADVLLAADRRWWLENEASARAFGPGLKVTVRPPGGSEPLDWPDVLELRNAGADTPYDDRPTHLGGGGNSGAHAVQLAAKRGCTKILLLGFDMKGIVGQRHWFGEHPWRNGECIPFELFIARFKRAAREYDKRGIRVINCTPGSALTCFPSLSVYEALRC